jgi:hypothetical protein
MLPPSTGKSTKIFAAEHAQELTEVDQEFIDAVFAHNGRPAPRPPVLKPKTLSPEMPTDEVIPNLNALLQHIDSSCGREDWLKVIMAIFHETRGSEEGFKLADGWSSEGSNYKGTKDVLTTWRSLNPDVANPITMATLCKRVDAAGGDWMKTLADLEPGFEILKEKTIVIQPGESTTAHTKPKNNPLARFSLTGQSEELEREAVERVPLLGPVAMIGQSTIFYAAPNTGKTLINLKLLTESIEAGRVLPNNVFYLNMDDDSKGLVEKLKIAEEYGLHMLAEGYNGFTAKAFLNEIRDLIDKNQCNGIIIILDTIKKFVDLMNKSQCRDYNLILGQFVIKGGSLVALAHTNKNSRSDGSPVHAGTTDMLEDFSCAYTLREISEKYSREKIVLFEKLKGRGGVANNACYSYLNGQEICYNEMFLSVQEADPERAASIEQAAAMQADEDVIKAVIARINEGVNTKMRLANAAAKHSGASKRSVLRLIEKYTGTDPKQHRWYFVRGERGKQIFQVLDDLQNQE